MIKINLLSEGRKPVVARKAKPTISFGGQDPNNLLLVAGLIVGGLVFGGRWYMLKSELDSVNADIRQANTEYEQLRQIIQDVKDFEAKKENLENKVNVIKDLKRKQQGPVIIMDKISRALPDLVWLEAMNIRGDTIMMRGRAFNTNAVASFIQNLNEVEEFTEPNARNIAAGGDVFSFQITVDVIPPPIPEDEEGAEGNPDGA